MTNIVFFSVYVAVQLEDGDIIWLQKPLQPGAAKCRYPNVPAFLEYVHNRQVYYETLVKCATFGKILL